MQIVIDFDLSNEGIDNTQYFQGAGTHGTDYDEAIIGTGETFREAAENAVEQAHQSYTIDEDTNTGIGEAIARMDYPGESVSSEYPTTYRIEPVGFPGTAKAWEYETISDAVVDFMNGVRQLDRKTCRGMGVNEDTNTPSMDALINEADDLDYSKSGEEIVDNDPTSDEEEIGSAADDLGRSLTLYRTPTNPDLTWHVVLRLKLADAPVEA